INPNVCVMNMNDLTVCQDLKKSLHKLNCGYTIFVYITPKKLLLINITAIAGIYVPKYFSIKSDHTATINVTSPFTEKGTINKNTPNNDGRINFKYVPIECPLISFNDVTPINNNAYLYI